MLVLSRIFGNIEHIALSLERQNLPLLHLPTRAE